MVPHTEETARLCIQIPLSLMQESYPRTFGYLTRFKEVSAISDAAFTALLGPARTISVASWKQDRSTAYPTHRHLHLRPLEGGVDANKPAQ
jgi:hypothetical protein